MKEKQKTSSSVSLGSFLFLAISSFPTAISHIINPINNPLPNFCTRKFNFCTRNDWFLHQKRIGSAPEIKFSAPEIFEDRFMDKFCLKKEIIL